MPEDKTIPVDPHAGDTGNPQPDVATTSTDPHAGDSPNDTLTLEEARKIRSESTNLRKRLKDAETLAAELKTFKEQIEASQLSDKEKQELEAKKLQEQLASVLKKNDDLTTQYQQHRTTVELERAARRIGATNEDRIDDAIKLIDRSALELDENGIPTNAEKLLKKFAESHDWLIRLPLTSGGATNPPRSSTDGSGEVTEQYVQDVMSGKIAWNTLTKEQRTKINQWQAQHAYKF